MVKRTLLFLLAICLCVVAEAAQKHRFTLVIDAGHGGKDAGACAFRAKEKDINLKVALAFGRYVEKHCPDVRVLYTRKTDVFIPLHERANLANSNKADVFISIHTNSVASKKPIRGLETYTMGIRRSDEKLSAAKRENEVILIEDNYKQHYSGYDPRSPESMIVFEFMNEQNMAKSVELARLIQQNVCSTARRPNKGVKQDAFLVLRETSMPACLVELGYITTLSEKEYLVNKNNVELMGLGLYQAFVAYKSRQTGTKAPVARVEPPLAEPAVADSDRAVDDRSSSKGEKARAEEETPRKQESQARTQDDAAPATSSSVRPVFKVQILTSDQLLKPGDKRLKGQTKVDRYKDGKIWKYTVGCSEDYSEILRLRRRLASLFPKAFIVAFRGDQRMDKDEAVREYQRNKRKK